ncbi:MAG: putative ABC transporter permease [Oscillibacter sp.]|nr:putative ABC transporter permease [Oscillibacter sp.]
MVLWLWYFGGYSFLGWIAERIFAAATHSLTQRRRCLLLLPFCPVYGLGMMAVLALPASWRQGPWLILSGAIATTIVEYFYHWVCELWFGVWFWASSGVIGNLGGRVSLPFTLAWGILSALAIWMFQPIFQRLAERTPPVAALVFLLVFTADAVCSARYLTVTHNLEAMRYALG